MEKTSTTLQSKPASILIHLILWILFIQIIFDVGGLYYSFQELVTNEGKIDDAFLQIPFLIVFFYLNSQWLIPRFLKKKTWWKYLLLVILVYGLVVFVSFLIFIWIEYQGFLFRIDRFEFLDFSLILHLLILLGSLSWSISKIAFHNSEQEQLARQKQKEAELKFLVAQFNPHFLFNTLNSIYYLAATENAPKTTEAILKLSEIMRYPINKGTAKKVLLAEEIQFIEDYIILQKLRLPPDYPIYFSKEGSFENIKVMPLSFMPLVENAFKYGISQRYKTPIDLNIKIENEHIIFSIKNQITQEKHISSFQTGIKNLKDRLEIIYADKYSITINHNQSKYEVTLHIQI